MLLIGSLASSRCIYLISFRGVRGRVRWETLRDMTVWEKAGMKMVVLTLRARYT
jgi:cytochrome c oxidase subunit IV